MQKFNKIVLIIISIAVVIGAVCTAIIINRKDNKENKASKEQVETKVSEVEILDECTDEYEELENIAVTQTNSGEEKISPNCRITLKTYYKGCKDEINQYIVVSEDLVNKTKKDLQNKYPEYKIESFDSTQIVLYKEEEGECGKHYLLKDDNGTITIYKILENGEEEVYEKTEISTSYLTQMDNIDIKQGIRVNGDEELNELIENFE